MKEMIRLKMLKLECLEKQRWFWTNTMIVAAIVMGYLQGRLEQFDKNLERMI